MVILFASEKEQFDLPAMPVELAHSGRGKSEMIAQQYDRSLMVGIIETHSSQPIGIETTALGSVRRPILSEHRYDWLGLGEKGLVPSKGQIALGPQHEVSALQIQGVELGEVEVAEVHDIDSA